MTHDKEGDIPLELLGQTGRERKKSGGKRKREEENMREKLLFLSSFLEDPTVNVRWSERQSSSSQRELRIETKIREFRQTPRGRGFSYSVLCLA